MFAVLAHGFAVCPATLAFFAARFINFHKEFVPLVNIDTRNDEYGFEQILILIQKCGVLGRCGYADLCFKRFADKFFVSCRFKRKVNTVSNL